ncbi:discoidin domain-containing protein [Streptomyces lavendulae]|uniref:discoidin domain-containing protein n=1 Tax=Streptomyces lavendulae TaxID=1914 RepID=UPI0036C5A395
MTDTDLIVPIRVNALAANEVVRRSRRFQRWEPLFGAMLDHKDSGEPLPFENTHDLDEWFEGVHVQWELPEALTEGFYDESGGDTHYPLVPNRWLVVRYAETREQLSDPWQRREPAGWVVQSDYLSRDYQDPADPPWTEPEHGWGTSTFLDPRSTQASPAITEIGRYHELTPGNPWTEPGRREPFLNAVGAGLPSFAAFEPYHRDVFSFRDILADLRVQGRMPRFARLSHFVMGWYSEPGIDILRNTLPPGASVSDILDALGWTTPTGEIPTVLDRTLYAGSALGIEWDHKGPPPASDLPHESQVKAAVGHSTDEAYAALVENQTRSPRQARLLQALYQGSLDTFDGPDGATLLAEATHRSWFSGHGGGSVWHIVRRVSDAPEPVTVPPVPDWLAPLNAAQRAYDEALPKLTQKQWRLWTLHWLIGLTEVDDPPPHPGFDPRGEAAIEYATLKAEVESDRTEVERLRAQIPHGDSVEELQGRIDEYADERGLDPALELRREPDDTFHTTADPVLLLQNTGSKRPLGRDVNAPLPCRLTSELVTRALIAGEETDAPDEPGLPPSGTANLPEACTRLLSEFALLDTASRTATDSGRDSALHDITEERQTYVKRGALAEYTVPWRQPWLPMFLQWQLFHCPTPYHTGGDTAEGTYHWSFNGSTFEWLGSGAPKTDDPDEGVEGHRMALFARRSYLAPTVSFVTGAQLSRFIATYPKAPRAALRALRDSLEDLDDLLSQRLDGFNDWLLQHDGNAQLAAPSELADLIGPDNHVPDPASDPVNERFQPVRAGQFFFLQLVMIDRYGQTLSKVWSAPEHDGPYQFEPIRASSVLPSEPLYTDPEPDGKQRYIALPPRILQPARVRLRAVDSFTERSAPEDDNPVVGWLMLNYLDESLLVHAPDGQALGELRLVLTTGDESVPVWAPLPHAVYTHPEDFVDVYPELAKFLIDLIENQPPTAFADLMTTIDQTLDNITNTAAHDDDAPAQLVGRPVALVRAHLSIELDGPPLTDSTWRNATHPPVEDYPNHTWPVRLGDRLRLSDGLIGYFSSGSGPDQDTSYGRFYAVAPAGNRDYVLPIGTGQGLALPARPPGQASTHRLTLLVEPHTPVHAVTDILPVADLRLDSELVHNALSNIQASFRLNPLLAPVRTPSDRFATSSLGATLPHVETRVLDNDLGSFYWSEDAAHEGDWVMVDLGADHEITAVDLYLGDPAGNFTPAGSALETATEAEPETWTPLGPSHPRVSEIHHTPESPVTARYVRLHITVGQPSRLAMRSFDISVAPDARGILMPQPSVRFGSWLWSQPRNAVTAPPPWDDFSIIAADGDSYHDDPVPAARAGHLRLRPLNSADEESATP